jgi:hypothetical protein
MKQETLILEQYNEEAMKLFLVGVIKMYPIPALISMYNLKDWENGYEALNMVLEFIPDVVKAYNKQYQLVLTQNN